MLVTYLDKHNLLTGKKALKDNKVKCIISHVLRNDTLQQLTQTLSLVPDSNKENAWMNQTRMTTTVMIMMRRGRLQKRTWSSVNDLDETAELGDSEIEENEDQHELFDQVILTCGNLATTWQSRFLVRN